MALTSVGIILCVGALAAAIWPAWFTGSQNALVVYCAHDSVYADAILKDFEKQTGIAVNVLYDSEATKSLGLVNQLKNEKDAPHCDVFWNNELLGTMDLAHEGVLEPYKGTGYERIPAQYKDDEGRWAGFAARMRVVDRQSEAADADKGGNAVSWSGSIKTSARAAISNPLYGTTLDPLLDPLATARRHVAQVVVRRRSQERDSRSWPAMRGSKMPSPKACATSAGPTRTTASRRSTTTSPSHGAA